MVCARNGVSLRDCLSGTPPRDAASDVLRVRISTVRPSIVVDAERGMIVVGAHHQLDRHPIKPEGELVALELRKSRHVAERTNRRVRAPGSTIDGRDAVKRLRVVPPARVDDARIRREDLDLLAVRRSEKQYGNLKDRKGEKRHVRGHRPLLELWK